LQPLLLLYYSALCLCHPFKSAQLKRVLWHFRVAKQFVVVPLCCPCAPFILVFFIYGKLARTLASRNVLVLGDNCRNQRLFAQVLNGNFLQQINSHGRSLDDNDNEKECHKGVLPTIGYLVLKGFSRKWLPTPRRFLVGILSYPFKTKNQCTMQFTYL